MDGTWRWQPAAADAREVPADHWGEMRVPDSWPGRNAPAAAWYQREISIPPAWSGRRITLYAEYLNSYAAVYVDGTKTGDMRYPAGEVDITSAAHAGKHVLTLLVVAMPLKAVLLSFNDTASSREVAGKVDRKGLCGDVYLTSTPRAARIADVKIDTSVRRWQITFDTALDALDPNAKYTLRTQILDGTRQVEEFTSRPFTPADLTQGRFLFTANWRPAKLWDTNTPQNQYQASVTLLTSAGKPLDTALPQRFGFREFWIDGRDFYLNGIRIYLSAIPLDNGQLSMHDAGYEATRATLRRFKSFGINFVYTHNYGCEPGAHYSFAQVLRAADDEGMLLAFSQPHFGHYDWTAPDADRTNGYARHAEFYVRAAQNHPAVVAYSTSHNSTGYGEDMNPDMIDGIQAPREQWALRNASRALRAEAIIRRIDPSRIVYHHASGNLGALHVGLVRTLGHHRRQARFHLRVQRALPVGLGDVPRLVQGQARVRQRRCAVGFRSGRVGCAIPGRPRLPGRRGGEAQHSMGGGEVPQGAGVETLGLSAEPQLPGVRRPLPRNGVVHHR
jgi:beta-galactosidase/beta-glucuronidase